MQTNAIVCWGVGIAAAILASAVAAYYGVGVVAVVAALGALAQLAAIYVVAKS